MSRARKNLGEWGEVVAKEYLIKNGYVVEASNYRTKQGEIDLVCWEKNKIVFFEIKNIVLSSYLTITISSLTLFLLLFILTSNESFIMANILALYMFNP